MKVTVIILGALFAGSCVSPVRTTRHLQKLTLRPHVPHPARIRCCARPLRWRTGSR